MSGYCPNVNNQKPESPSNGHKFALVYAKFCTLCWRIVTMIADPCDDGHAIMDGAIHLENEEILQSVQTKQPRSTLKTTARNGESVTVHE
jgi:hypothetical protein